MADSYALARPYAKALFEIAQERAALTEWSAALAFAAQVAEDPDIQALASNPRVERSELESALVDICAEHLPADGENFIRLLVRNDRLAALPGIAAQYERLRADAEQTVDGELISARPVAAEQREKIEKALGNRLGRKVRLKVVEDPSVLGGAVIRAGDLVIDGSARGRLDKLAVALSQ